MDDGQQAMDDTAIGFVFSTAVLFLTLMAFKFENLRVWQLAFQLADEVHHLALNFPKVELFSLTNQIKKAADSVVLNIAEGCIGTTNAENKRFLNIALRSAFETAACLMMAKRRKYLSEESFQANYNSYEQLCRMITKYRDGLN